MLTNDEILELIRQNENGEDRYQACHNAIRDRIVASGASEKVAGNAMYYAYDHGHSAGDSEVLRVAFNLLTEIFEA